jgi:hypothetical protein
MHRLLAILPVLALAACAGGHATVAPKTRLTVRVMRNDSTARYTLTCRPAGGSAPAPVKACRALEDFLPRRDASRAACSCALYVNRIMVSGVLDGRRLREPVEVSACAACGLGARALTDASRAFAAFGLAPGGGI